MTSEQVLALPAAVTASNASALLEQYQSALSGVGSLVLDGSALTSFDSSALALLLALRRRAQVAGKTLVSRNLSPNVRKLAILYGLEGLV
jgi:phospholipid transport system transporter-binding protein